MNEETGYFTAGEIDDLRKVFFAQSYEILEHLQDSLLRLEEAPDDGEALKAVKRYIHTLKGDANSIGLTGAGSLCHSMEDLLSAVSGNGRQVTEEMTALLFSAADTVHRIISENERGSNGSSADGVRAEISAYLRSISTPAAGRRPGPAAAAGERIGLSEYQALQAAELIRQGRELYEIAVAFHPQCTERGVAAWMIQKHLSAAGQVIAVSPDPDSDAAETAASTVCLVASSAAEADLVRAATVAGITETVSISAYRQETLSGHTGNPAAPLPAAAAADFLRIEAGKIDRVMNLVGELIIGRSMIEQIARDAEAEKTGSEIARRLEAAAASMNRTVSDLQMTAMKLRMVPVSQVFRKFPRVVRDLAAEKDKAVRLVITGRETELDKSIVDALGEPLGHLMRNAVDHGIESPAERTALGKPEEATITLSAYHEAARIVIEVSDDGRGIDREKLREKALAKGYITRSDAEQMTEREMTELIFCAGLSTADEVTGTSGRGVGMDAVKAAIEGIKGVIEVESAQGRGTTFRLRLPLTLAVIKALLVEVGGRDYAVPIAMVSEVTMASDDDISTVDGREVFLLRDRVISVIRPGSLFGHGCGGGSRKTLVVLAVRGGNVGLLVDRLTSQQELVIKALDTDFTRSDLVSGASILGNGRVVLILDAPAVFSKAIAAEKQRLAGAGA